VSTTTKAISAVGVQVFVKLDATTVQVAVLRSSLKLTPAITSCVYLDHQQSYEYAVKLFKADGQSSAISALTPARSPTVFVCQLKEPGDAAAMKNLFAKRPGVFRVVTGVWQST
jgi:cell division protein FtsX